MSMAMARTKHSKPAGKALHDLIGDKAGGIRTFSLEACPAGGRLAVVFEIERVLSVCEGCDGFEVALPLQLHAVSECLFDSRSRRRRDFRRERPSQSAFYLILQPLSTVKIRLRPLKAVWLNLTRTFGVKSKQTVLATRRPCVPERVGRILAQLQP
jgi:hypothetical protein